MPKPKNLASKTRPFDKPYEIWQAAGWEWRVLKKYQTEEQEANNPHARWLCAVTSPHTFGSYDLGDTYVKEVQQNAVRTYRDPILDQQEVTVT